MQIKLLPLLLLAAAQCFVQAAASAEYASASLWDLAAGDHRLTLCATAATASVLDATFEIRAIASDVQDANEAPVTVTNASVVAVNSNDTSATYCAKLSVDKPCVQVALPIETESFYLLLAQYSQEDLRVWISNVNNEDVAMVKCLTGCDYQAAVTSRGPAEVAASASSQQGHSESWTGPIAASLVISLTSLAGVFILGFDKGRAESIVEFATSFAAGCLMGVVVFHMWPEGLKYLEDAGDWMNGMFVLLGVAFSMATEQGIHMVLESFGGAPCDHNHTHEHHPHHDHSVMDSHSPSTSAKLSPRSSSPGGHTHASHHLQDDSHYMAHPWTPLDPNRGTAASYETFGQKYVTSLKSVEPVAWITAMGDFFHAFVDGAVLAIGFKSCSASVGWSVALGIVLHEVPHRVGDFFIFLKAGMLVPQALLINFIASLSSLLGAIVLLAAGTVSDHTLGALLSFGTGALLFIAMVELMPPMMAVRERKRVWMHFAWFSFGCILIGLSVLQDTECEK